MKEYESAMLGTLDPALAGSAYGRGHGRHGLAACPISASAGSDSCTYSTIERTVVNRRTCSSGTYTSNLSSMPLITYIRLSESIGRLSRSVLIVIDPASISN